MSIIIGVITKNNQLYLGADKRAKLPNGTINDNFIKLFLLRPNLYLGITGIAEFGLFIKNKVMELSNFNELSVQELIDYIDTIYQAQSIDSTILLSGRFENSQAFIWNKSTNGQKRFIKNNGQDILYSINTNNNLDIFEKEFNREIRKSNFDFIRTIERTIEYASMQDDSISKCCDIVKI